MQLGIATAVFRPLYVCYRIIRLVCMQDFYEFEGARIEAPKAASGLGNVIADYWTNLHLHRW